MEGGPKVCQTNSAPAFAAGSELNPPSLYVAPPIESRMVFPFFWHVVISSLNGRAVSVSVVKKHNSAELTNLRAFEKVGIFEECTIVVRIRKVDFRNATLAVDSYEKCEFKNLKAS